MSRQATEQELAAAESLASDVEREGGVSSVSLNELLSAFEIRRFTDASRDRITEALEQAGLEAQPSIYEVERGDHVTLILERAAATVAVPSWGSSAPPDARGGAVRVEEPAQSGVDKKPWYRRPSGVAGIAAVLLFLLVGGLGDEEQLNDSSPQPSPIVVPRDDNSTKSDAAAREESQARERKLKARLRRERQARVRAERRQRAAAARARREQAAARRERQERRQAQAAALALQQQQQQAPAAEEPSSGGGCAAGYSPCVPSYPPDVDCPDVGPVTVSGSDPHGLDADGDGVACGGIERRSDGVPLPPEEESRTGRWVGVSKSGPSIGRRGARISGSVSRRGASVTVRLLKGLSYVLRR